MAVDSTVCKFRCERVEDVSLEYSDPSQAVSLVAEYDESRDEDRNFSQYTPVGALETVITNPNVQGFFEVGKSYYLTITRAD